MIRPSLCIALLALAAPPAIAQDNAAGITFDHYAAKARERLMTLDTDHDGKISKDEFAARAAGMGGGNSGRDPARMFARLDSNHDGFVDRAEMDAMLAQRFARMDANHDGVLTADERSAMRQGGGPEQ